MSSCQLMFPGVRSSLESGFDLSLLLPVIGLIFTVVSKLLLLYSTINKHLRSKTIGCFSGCLMSSASIQKLFCGIYSVFMCSFDEFVGEKVVSLSNSSAILIPPSYISFLKNTLKARKIGPVTSSPFFPCRKI